MVIFANRKPYNTNFLTMKRTMFLVALTLAFAAASAQNLPAGSYNIRNDNSGDARKGDDKHDGGERIRPAQRLI